MPGKIELAIRSDDIRHGVQQGAQLGLAVSGLLDRLGIEPERDVVDEDAAVHLCQVDSALPAVDERVQGTDDVVTVNAEVEREVVSRSGGHTRVREIQVRGHRRHHRL
jgi:hypothetical protein